MSAAPPSIRGHPGTIVAMSMTPADCARLFGGSLEGGGDATRPLRGIEVDSRKVVEHAAFVALRGEHEDGHRYVADATARGALLAVVDSSFRTDGIVPPLLLRVDETSAALRRACTRRLEELACAVVAVTGSVGKTTAKEMCATALGRLHVARTPGNLNTWTGIPQSVLAVYPPVDVFVAEVAMSAPGEIGDLARMIRPTVGVVLNVGQAHVGLLGSVAAIAEAKAELLDELPRTGVAVCNADDEQVRGVAKRARGRVVWFGLHSRDAAYTARDIAADGLHGSRFILVGPDGVAPALLRLPGDHAVLDACAAAAVAARFGIGVAEVADRLAELSAPEHRGAVHSGLHGALVYDDCYNSSPTSLAAALRVLGGSGAARRIAVLGDMLELGAQAEEAHREAGRQAAASATSLIAVGEHAQDMVEAAVGAGMPRSAAHVTTDAENAAELARAQCGPDVAILVKASHSLALERVVERLLA